MEWVSKNGQIMISHKDAFFSRHCFAACRILVPWLRIKPGPQQWKYKILTTELPGDSLNVLFILKIKYFNTLILNRNCLEEISSYSNGMILFYLFSKIFKYLMWFYWLYFLRLFSSILWGAASVPSLISRKKLIFGFQAVWIKMDSWEMVCMEGWGGL